MKELRDVRNYHWKEAMFFRKSGRNLREKGLQGVADAMDRLADVHIKCVQILNDYVSGPAEQDTNPGKPI